MVMEKWMASWRVERLISAAILRMEKKRALFDFPHRPHHLFIHLFIPTSSENGQPMLWRTRTNGFWNQLSDFHLNPDKANETFRHKVRYRFDLVLPSACQDQDSDLQFHRVNLVSSSHFWPGYAFFMKTLSQIERERKSPALFRYYSYLASYKLYYRYNVKYIIIYIKSRYKTISSDLAPINPFFHVTLLHF